MILTLTPNPSLDLLFRTDRLVWDDANRVAMPRRRAGGQGVNVVRAVAALAPAAPAVAVAPLGGPVGRELEAMLRAEGRRLRAVEMEGDTRVFVGVRERDTGRSLLVNPRGPAAPPGLADRLLEAVGAELDGWGDGGARTPEGGGARTSEPGGAREGEGWVICCGSLLPGLPADLYARVGALARSRGARFVPDCDGTPLALAVEAGSDLLVPNAHEAGRLVGGSVESPDAAMRAARRLLDRGRAASPERVVVTLGPEGAVSADRTGAWWARPELPADLGEEAEDGSAVGAGDAFLAALILALEAGAPTPEALREAVATGTASLLSRGAALVRAADVARVRPHVRVDKLEG